MGKPRSFYYQIDCEKIVIDGDGGKQVIEEAKFIIVSQIEDLANHCQTPAIWAKVTEKLRPEFGEYLGVRGVTVMNAPESIDGPLPNQLDQPRKDFSSEFSQ